MLYLEPKKNPGVDLNSIRPLIFSVSLTITMVLANLVFEWKTYDDAVVNLGGQKSKNTFEEMLEIPPTEITPPAPAVRVPTIVEVRDEEKVQEDIKIDLDIEMTSESALPTFINTPVEVKLEEEESEKIFTVVEEKAAPKDGLSAFYKYVAEHIRYPAQALRMDIEGRVFVQFVVERNGLLTQLEVIKGIGAGCDEEAIRIIRDSPPWTSAKQRGRPVRQRMVLPIFFQLSRR